MVVVAKKSADTVAGPAIRCRAGRAHPPTVEYHWTFYPERTDGSATRNGDALFEQPDDDRSSSADRPVRGEGLDGSFAQNGGGGGDGGTSYTFTTTTATLKSYFSAAVSAAATSAGAVRPAEEFLHGRLECRAVNAMGKQIRPCVYRITGAYRLGAVRAYPSIRLLRGSVPSLSSRGICYVSLSPFFTSS